MSCSSPTPAGTPPAVQAAPSSTTTTKVQGKRRYLDVQRTPYLTITPGKSCSVENITERVIEHLTKILSPVRSGHQSVPSASPILYSNYYNL